MQRRRLFHYTLLTRDPAEFLERLLDMLRAESLGLEDFEFKELANGQHEVKVSITTSMEVNRRLLTKLPRMGSGLRTTAHDQVD